MIAQRKCCDSTIETQSQVLPLSLYHSLSLSLSPSPALSLSLSLSLALSPPPSLPSSGCYRSTVKNWCPAGAIALRCPGLWYGPQLCSNAFYDCTKLELAASSSASRSLCRHRTDLSGVSRSMPKRNRFKPCCASVCRCNKVLQADFFQARRASLGLSAACTSKS